MQPLRPGLSLGTPTISPCVGLRDGPADTTTWPPGLCQHRDEALLLEELVARSLMVKIYKHW